MCVPILCGYSAVGRDFLAFKADGCAADMEVAGNRNGVGGRSPLQHLHQACHCSAGKLRNMKVNRCQFRLTAFRQNGYAVVGSICSLSGLVSLRPYVNFLPQKGREFSSNPLPKGRGFRLQFFISYTNTSF